MDRVFIGLPPLPKALERISKLGASEFESLRAAVSTPDGFRIGEAGMAALAQSLQVTESDVADLLQSLEFLYDRCREWEEGDADFKPPLRSFLKETRLWGRLGSNPDTAFDRLAALLTPNPVIEHDRKLQWLRTGMLENAVEFASFVDLRPDFTADRAEIRGIIPVVILQIRTESDRGRDRSHVVQLTVDGIRKLRSTIEDAEKKLVSMKAIEPLSSLLYENKNPKGRGL